VRRAEAIRKHLSAVICEPRELQRLFDLLLDPSEDLRQYLSGDRNDQVQVARQLINILPAAAIIEILAALPAARALPHPFVPDRDGGDGAVSTLRADALNTRHASLRLSRRRAQRRGRRSGLNRRGGRHPVNTK
jgi:hypothetical protein